MKKTVGILLGTRPEAIKMLPVYLRMKQSELLEPILISTGQHKEMLQQIFDFFDVKPDVDFQLMAANQSLASLTARLCNALQGFLDKQPLDLMMVQGDTTSAFMGGLISFYNQIPVGHVEAGLRTYNKYAPFPEEINRKLVSCVADYNFAPTQKAKEALAHEHYSDVYVVGNTVVDALLKCLDLVNQNLASYKARFPFLEDGRKMVLITGHRRESFGEGFQNICESIRYLANKYPELRFVYPVHLNPNVRKVVYEILGAVDNIQMIEPLPYDDMVFMMSQSYILLTDSGGIQEEAPSFNIPALVMRDTTERMEGIEKGCAILVGTDKASIIKHFEDLHGDETLYQRMAAVPNPYGDGTSSDQIVKIVEQCLAN